MENNKVLGLDGKLYNPVPENVNVFEDNTPQTPQTGMIMDNIDNPLENKENTQSLNELESKTKIDAKALQRLMSYQNRLPSVREFPKIGRNDPCPCGSNLKYKNCCLSSGKYEKLVKQTKK